MTEDEWKVAPWPLELLGACRNVLTDRARRLIGMTACRLLPRELLGPRLSSWLTLTEQFAEQPSVKMDSASMRRELRSGWRSNIHSTSVGQQAFAALSHHLSGDLGPLIRCVRMASGPTERPGGYAVDPDLVALLRDVIGNPFRPVAFDPRWRTSAAVQLASRMYESRDFALMPILADALQDAGCDSPGVLDHCRDPHGVHVRGCWVVDGVLGKS